MKFRKLEKRDTRELASVLRSYWKERGMSYSQRWAENYVRKGHRTEIKKDNFFIVEENKKPVGCISVVVYEGDVAELRDLVVKKEFRREGYGERLVRNAIGWCRKNKIRKIYALVFPGTLGFWKNLGFSREGYLKSHFKSGENLVFVSKFLK